MKVTVTTTSSKLKDLLSSDNLSLIKKMRKRTGFTLTIQNLWTDNVYVSNGEDATITDSILVSPWYQGKDMLLSNIFLISLISETNTNSNVRLIIT